MKVFISYSLEDKKEAGQLRDRLNLLGFNCFLAHADIPKGAEWHDEIIRNLKASSVFIPILTEKAVASPWVMQECGMAHLLRTNKKPLLIIPLTVDRDDPPGCLSVYQSIRTGIKFWSLGKVKMEDELTRKLALEIVGQSTNAEAIKSAAIASLHGAAWQNAEYIVEFLCGCKTIQYSQFLDLIAACRSNFAVTSSDRAMQILYWFMEKHRAELSKDQVSVNAWNKIHERYAARKEEERRRAEEMRQLEEQRRKEREEREKQQAAAAQQNPVPAAS